jgi:hypothetical protein
MKLRSTAGPIAAHVAVAEVANMTRPTAVRWWIPAGGVVALAFAGLIAWRIRERRRAANALMFLVILGSSLAA